MLMRRGANRLGNGQYLASGYFSSEAADSVRWEYYRKATEGQNTLLIGGRNQNPLAAPPTTYGSTGEAQTSLLYNPANSSTAYFTADLSTSYNDTS